MDSIHCSGNRPGAGTWWTWTYPTSLGYFHTITKELRRLQLKCLQLVLRGIVSPRIYPLFARHMGQKRGSWGTEETPFKDVDIKSSHEK